MDDQFPDRTVLVTGGAGFIGSHLVETLLSRGANVVVADDFSRGQLDHIPTSSTRLTVRPVDLTTFDGCIRATEEVEDVFHLAASVGGIHYIQREHVGGLTPSVLMNQHMLEAARINEIDRFLFASSACIYRQEHDELNRFSEDQAIPANPHSTYGWAKILGEIGCQAYHEDYDISTRSARIFNAYGPRENLDPDSSHVIPSLCRKVIEEPPGGAITVFGDGTQERGFIYVSDLAEGLIRTLLAELDGGAVNVGNAKEVVSIAELAERIISISGKDLEIEHDLSKPSGTDKYCADTTKMREVLDWEPKISLDDGLREVYRWAESEIEGKRQTPSGRAGVN